VIRIRVVSVDGAALEGPLAATFGSAGGDIGRGLDCTLVLPDPERNLSRRQALIVCRDDCHFIRQIGSNLAIELDGELLATEVDYTLADGAEIRIGPYLLRVDRPPERVVVADDVLAALGPQGKTARPSVFGDLLGDAGPPAPPSTFDELDLVIGEPTGAGGRATPAPATPQPVHDEPQAAPASDDDLVAALYAGLGLPLPPAARSARHMRLVGELLRATIKGAIELLAARAVAKRTFGATPTLLRTNKANNPLKFSPDADVALAHLLGPAQRGFIAPLEAVNESFDDLRRHELAVLAGTRAAVQAVLARFDPGALESGMETDAMWDKLLPASRKARLWEQFGERYAKAMLQSEEDFDSLFRRAFVKAYEAQVEALEGSPPAQ
jgi:type VI secretion system FHA domain protein